MIIGFKSKALKRYWTRADASGLRPDWRSKILLILSRLEIARSPAEMDLPGLSLHPLKGNLAGRFAVTVSRNWRITFTFEGQHAIDVDLEDYHGR